MIPGMGGRMNPKQLNAMMRQMGITMEEIDDVQEVVIRTPTRVITISPAEVSKMTAQGQVSWQVTGKAVDAPREAPAPVKLDVREEDVDLVAETAQVSREQARKALEAANGNPAEAIVKLLGD